MKWDVRTAHPQNGRERTITVDAADAGDAVEKVSKHGLLIHGEPEPRHDLPSDAEPPPVVDYRSPEPRSAVPPASVAGAHADLAKHGKSLESAAMLVVAIAILCTCFALFPLLFVFLLAIFGPERPSPSQFLMAVAFGVGVGIYAFCFWVLATLLRWLAAVGAAVREIAINSRR